MFTNIIGKAWSPSAQPQITADLWGGDVRKWWLIQQNNRSDNRGSPLSQAPNYRSYETGTYTMSNITSISTYQYVFGLWGIRIKEAQINEVWLYVWGDGWVGAWVGGWVGACGLGPSPADCIHLAQCRRGISLGLIKTEDNGQSSERSAITRPHMSESSQRLPL